MYPEPFLVGETRVIPTVAAIGPRERTSRLDAVRSWALDLPGANGRLGMVGFSWGGAVLKAQHGLDANRRATEDAWPRTLAFLRQHLAD